MPTFSEKSKLILGTCDVRLQEICNNAIEIMDFTVLCGHRNEEEQNEAFRKGNSKLKFPHSKHNSTPSKAVDLAPYPIDWVDYTRFTLLAGVILGIAHQRGVKLRWGGDFNGDFILKNDRFLDMPHFEIVD